MTAEELANPQLAFPAVHAAIQDGIRRQLHHGVQIYVSHRLVPKLNSAIGQSAPDVMLRSDTKMLWRSAGKPLTAVLILQLIEQGAFGLETTLREILPESSATDKASITIRQLLTHVAGFPTTETGWPAADWQATFENVLRTPCTIPIGTAAYHPQSSWFVLGEIVRRFHDADADFPTVFRRKLLEPIGMRRTAIAESFDGNTHTRIYERAQSTLVESAYSQGSYLSRPSPGGGLRGPVSELGLLYEILLRKGQLPDGSSFILPETVERMILRQRIGEFDQTLQHAVDMGLGLIVDSNRYGPETVPYGFGRHCSEETFGHGGAQCAMGFCDPVHDLVVAWAANGFCGEVQHQRRNRAINEAVYRDLKLC